MSYPQQQVQRETINVVGQKTKAYEDGGKKWLIRDDRDRWFQFYEQKRDGGETSAFRGWQEFAQQAAERKEPVAVRFTEAERESKVTSETYTVRTILGFGE
jgi:hypothetical protein